MATLPNPNPVPNSGSITYNYQVDPSLPLTSGGNSTNIVTTQINTADVQTTKSVNKAFANVGDSITYTITMKNAGNVTANNVQFTDTIPNGTSFNTGSVFVNNVSQPSFNPSPPTGFTITQIPPGSTATVVFSVTVTTIPSPNPIPNNSTGVYNYVVDPITNPSGITGGTNSNQVTTQVNNANIQSNKIVDKTSAKVGDVLTYSIGLRNVGNVTANNVVLKDTIPSGTSFDPGSVRINGAPNAGSPAPPTGLTVGTIAPGGVTTVLFTVTITTIPTINPIPNSATGTYNYTVDPASTNGASGSTNTNIVNTQLNQATIDNSNGGGMVKTVDKAFAKVGDVLTYTITLKNTGNVSATNVVFTDTIPNGTTLNPSSVRLNGSPVSGTPAPPTGISVGTIGPGAASTIIFTVTVNTIPNPNPIPNNSTVNYKYTVDPALPDGQSGSGNSNQVTTQVNQATIDNTNGGGLVKSVSKAFAQVNDVLTYTITMKNTGNVTATNVQFTDTIPNGTSFNTGSVRLNGSPVSGSPAPPTGVTVGTIAPGATSVLVFTVTVNTIPNPNPIPNNGTVTYNYTIDPAVPNGGSGSGNTNQVTTQVNQAIIDNTNGGGMVKSVDKAFAKVGDILTYTITLKNTGNVSATNVVLTDTIPSGTSFQTGTVFLNSVLQPSANPTPPTGVQVGTIGPGGTSVVTFQVKVTTIPSPNPIPNNSTVRYNFTIDPASPNGGSAIGNSNQVTTQVNQATIDNTNGGGLVKSVDKTFADVNDVLTYTITLKNTGNVTANNVVFTDTIPNGTSFNPGSVRVNGTQNPGSPAPPTGLNIGSIAPGSASTIIFTVTVNTIPTPNPIPNSGTVNYTYTTDPALPDGQSGSGNTNIVNTQVNNANFDSNSGGITKTVDKTAAKVGDILTYTIVLKNTGNVTANNVVFTDTIPGGTSYNPTSLRVNGTLTSGNPAPPTGITLSSIAPGGVTTVLFTVTITTIPTVNPIPNQGKVAYTYTTDPASPNGKSGQNLSNIVTTQLNQATIDNTNGGGMVKTVDKAFAKVGDVLTYSVTLKNTGNVTASSVVFTDTIPNGTSFNPGSVRVNGNQDPGNPAPPTGVNVGSIAPGAATTILFTVTVNTIPNPNPIPNNSTVNYKYTVDPALPEGQSGSGNSNQVTTQVNQANIDNTNGGGLVKSVDKTFAKVGDVLTYTITLKNTGNVTATNVVFTDTIPNDTTLVPNSVRLNGSLVSGSPAPPTGVTVGSIAPGAASTVIFQVTVNTVPSPNPIPNNGTVNYNFTIDPAVPNGGSGSGNTNQVTTQVNQATIDNTNGGGLVKTVDKATAKVGDVLTYTITLKNTGNVTATNVVISDTTPSGTSFNIGSVRINGNQNSGNLQPPTGLGVGSIAPGSSTVVVFQVTVTTIPSPNPIPNNSTVRYNFTIDPANPNGGSGSGNSNTVNTQVNQATIDNTNGGGLVKSVDKTSADVGDVLTYTIRLKNTGNVTADNVVFTDTIPSGTSFNSGSVRINGNPDPGSPAPPTGVNIGSIAPGATSTVIFTVTVNTIPNPNPIPNSGTVNYKYTVDPANPGGESGSGNSNTVNTQINNANFDNASGGIVKSVDKAFAKVGDVLTYTIRLKNTGNVTANNIKFTDTIPTDTTFVPNSFLINGAQQPGSPAPPTGGTVGTLPPNGTATIIFKVTVNTIPSPNPIPNTGRLDYTYTVDPSVPNGKSGANLSNTVNTQINQGGLRDGDGSVVKSVDRTTANIGDVINYKIVLTNKGNVDTNNIVFTDTIPNGTSFNTGSLKLNGNQQPGSPAPPTGLSVGTLVPGQVATIEFAVTVTTIPSPNPIPNSGTVNYNYTVDPSLPNGQNGSANTNIVTTGVSNSGFDPAKGGLSKTVDKAFAKVGDVINYTIVLKNTGNVSANNVVFTDTIPNDTAFNPNSVKLNGSIVPGNPNPQSGINLGTVLPGAVNTIQFAVTVLTIPSPNPIPNSGTVNYTFTVDPANPNGQSGANTTNIVNTQVNQGGFNDTNGSIIKSVNKSFAKVGDILNYSIQLTNKGNVSVNNIVFTDTIPNGTSYVAGTLALDNVQKPGTPAPPTGLTVGSMNPGQISTITFSVRVDTIPSPNPIPNSGTIKFTYTVDPANPNGQAGSANSNIVNTQINQANINTGDGGLVKQVDKTYAQVGDTLLYTLVLKNTGNVAANNVVLTDTIPNDTSFVPDSVKINGVPASGSPNPQTGITIGQIQPLNVVTVTFNVKVLTTPNPNPIPNSGTANFNYTVDPASPNGESGSGNSNIVKTTINQAVIDEGKGLVKSVDKAFAKVGDILTYTINMTNTGDVTANNVVFTDTIPNDTSFVPNSLIVNNNPVNGSPAPPTGVNVGSIGPKKTTVLIFKVKVNTIPNPNPIPNAGSVKFTYTVDPSVPNGGSGTGNTNVVTTQVNQANIDNTNGGGLVKAVDKAFAKIGDTLTYTITIKNTGNVAATNVVFQDTIPSGTSYVPDSVQINNTPVPGNPQTGVTVGTINPSQTQILTFQVTVLTNPSPNPIPNAGRVSYNFTIDPANPNGGSGTGNTNIVKTQVNSANINSNGGIVKSVDKAYAKVGDQLTYTIVLRNSGTVSANNVVLIDTIPNGTSFISGSVTQNGVPIAGNPNPPTGISLGTIGPSITQTIKFNVKVLTIPSPNPIPNSASVNYTFTEDPASPNGATGGGSSNIVNTQVNQASIDNNDGGLVKAVDKAYAKVGDTLTYSVTIKNTGNVDATNVVFTDTIPSGTSFNIGSVTVDNSPVSGSPAPPTGITIGTVAAGTSKVVSFKVTVNTIPNPNPIPNSGTVRYNYTIDPSVPNGGSGSGNTNTVTTRVNQADIDVNKGGMTKSVDKTFATVGDILTYTIRLKNTGNIAATSIVLTDTIPSGTTFEVDSVKLNGVQQPGANPSPGFGVNVGTLNPSQVATVNFSVKVVTIPSPNPIPNNSTVNYKFTIDPSIPEGESGSGNSNQVTTQVNTSALTTSKSVDKAYAAVNEKITYTIVARNTGNTAANSVTVFDTLPNGTSLVADTVKVNGNLVNGANPQTGILVGNIAVGGVATVQFTIVAITIPSPNPIVNTADTAFKYNVNPNGTSQASDRTTTNPVRTQINQAILSSTKSQDRTTADIGSLINYTVNLTNSGNVDANNVVFIDTIPNGTSFSPNSLTVNGTSNSGNPAPPSGVNIGVVPAGQTVAVAFAVKVDTIPSPNPIVNTATATYNYTVDPQIPNSNSGSTNTNSVRATVNNADFAISKTVDTNYAKVSDQLTYNITLTNTGNVQATSVALSDVLSNGISYVPNSLSIGGVNAGASSFPSTINVGTVNGKSTTVVSFKVKVDTIPTPNPIPNTSTVNFNYTVDPANPNGASGTRTSNTVTTQVNQGYLNLAKTVDKTNAIFGDIINYTLTLSNPGNVAINNVNVKDAIPSGTTFVPGSVNINGVPSSLANPASGILISQVGPSATVVITFSVKVGNALPQPNPIPNFATASFSYTVNPNTPNGQSGNVTSNTVNTNVNNGGFNPANGGINKSVDKAYSTVGETLTYTVNLKNTGNVPVNNIILTDTIPNGTSFIPDSVFVNGTNQPGANPIPGIGVALGSLNPNGQVQVQFKVKVETIPNPNPINNKAIVAFSYNADQTRVINDAAETNAATTTINLANFQGFSKAVDKAYANVGDELTYTLNIQNTGNVTAQNVVITDPIPGGTTFKPNSVIVDGSSKPGINPATGVSLGNIGPTGNSVIIFKVIVTTIPTVNPIPNAATASFSYVQDPTKPPVQQTANTNTVTTQVNNGNITGNGFRKTVDKAFGVVGDTLTYTITAANNGNVAVTNVVISDTIPNGTAFVPDSLTLNSLPIGGDVTAGIPVGTLNPGASAVLQFKVKVTQIPVPNPIPDAAIANYSFVVDPNQGPISRQSQTNTVTTLISNPDFNGNNFVKTVDKAFAGVGDTLTYTLTLTNKGNTAANNVKITDIIPSGTSFVAGSVTINGSSNAGANPQTGITIGSIAPNAQGVITFKVKVNEVPTPNPIPNTGTVTFTFTTDPANPNGNSGSGTSNTVTTQINDSNVAVVKSANKAFAKVGDKVEYTFNVTNTGNVAATEVVLTDPLPINTSFEINSVTLNGSQLLGATPQGGINIGALAAGSTAVVRFNVTIDSLPATNPMQNSGTASYKFPIDPNNPNNQTSKLANSNKVSIVVNSAAIDGNNFTKTVDKANAKVGDLLLYTINLSNSGNIDATNLVLTDPVPDGTEFVPGTVKVNGVTQSTANITSGINLGTLAPKGTIIVTFNAKVTKVPATNPINNVANLSYTFTPDPALPPQNANSTSNKATTRIANANLDAITKSVDKSFARVGEVLTYTTVLKNTGNVAATNVVFIDPIPVGTTLVPNSVTVNGATVTQNPAAGIPIGTLNPGDTRTVVFKVTVDQIPVINPIPNKAQANYNFVIDTTQPPASATVFSNQVTTLINDANLGEFRKAVDKTAANVGDELTYTVTAKNTGNIVASNVVITDAIPAGTSFVTGSVTINGVLDSASNPANGISVPDLLPGQTTAITFKVKVTSVPAINPIPNSATIAYTYKPDPNGSPVNGAGGTNTVTTQISNANLGQNLVKTVDKAFADVGDILTYTTTLKNSGNVPATNVVFTDAIPTGTTFVSGSVSVNGVTQGSANPGGGVTIGTIAPGATATVRFQVKVNEVPEVNPIPNTGTVNYQYTVTSGQAPVSASANTNTVTTQINSANLSGKGITKVVDLTEANTNSTLSYTITLKNTGNVTANNVVITDPIPTGTQFVTNSVSVNGVNTPGANPASGVPVGSIAPGATVTIFFQVKVTALPSPNPIPNKATVAYNYIVDPAAPAKNGNGTSNTVFTTITTAQLKDFVKNVDKSNADIGDLLTYTLSFTNSGNTTATNVVLVDPTPNGVAFIPNTVIINGVGPSADLPSSGIKVPDVGPGKTVSVSYKAQVTALPDPNPIPNSATANYTFIVGGAPVNASSTSNTVFTRVNNANVDSIVKSVSRAYADFDDILTYTISVRNTGNVTASSVVITDPIPSGTTFVSGSVIINGTPNASAIPGVGINVPDVPGGGQASVQFNVKVNSTAPSVNPIPDTAKVSYSFISDPLLPPENGNANSNTVFTQVNSGKLQINKSVDRNIADIGDELVYTVTATNIGTVNATGVVIIDTIPNGTIFKEGSVSINGSPSPSDNPELGINLNVVPVGAVSQITYRVIVTELPNPNPIPNFANANYSYSVDPNAPAKSASDKSSTVLTQVNNGNISPENGGFRKSVDKAYAKIGDTVNYTIRVRNTGNVTVNNVFFSDTLPIGTTFVPNSLAVNSATQTGANPQVGISLGSIGPSVTNTVTFSVKVTSLPATNPIPNTGAVTYRYTTGPNASSRNKSSLTNTVFTQINDATIDPRDGFIKSVDKAFADVNDTLNYSLLITNTGNVVADNIVFTDTVPGGTTLVPNSTTVNGAPVSGDINTGISIPPIPAGGNTTIIFQVTVTTIPQVNPIPNSGTIKYKFVYDPSLPATNASANSNIVTTQINSANFNPNDGSFVKIVDKTATNVNGVITYTLRVKNTGNVQATNVIVTDPIPPATTYIDGSLTVDGTQVPGSPGAGVSLGTIAPNASRTIIFKVRVKQIPENNVVLNSANIKYAYLVNPNLPAKVVTNPSNEVSTRVFYGDLSINKDVDKSYAVIADTLNYTIALTNKGNTTINNVVVNDTIPKGVTFVNNSVSVDGSVKNGVNPQAGITVGSIAPGNTSVITFKVTVDKATAPNIISPIINNALSNYNYSVDGQTVTDNRTSNNALTYLSFVNFDPNDGSFVKEVDKTVATLGDVLSYKISIRNTGNTTALNVLFTDPIPLGTTLVPGSFTVDGASQTASPGLGVALGNMGPLSSKVVQFKVLVTTLPSVNPIPNIASLAYNYLVNPNAAPVSGLSFSNRVNTQINYGSISGDGIVKSVAPTVAAAGDTLAYVVNLTNNGNITVNNVVLTDTIPNGTTLVPNSVSINGTIIPNASPSAGVTVGDIGPNRTATFAFNVKVISIPNPNPIPNSASTTYSYAVDSNRIINSSGNSNIVYTRISSPYIDPANGDFVKSADKSTAQIGDVITYSIFVRNSGNLAANNVIVSDSIPNNTSILPNSVTVDGVLIPNSSIVTGVTIPQILPNSSVTVTFKATVVSIPENKIVENFAHLRFSFTLPGANVPRTVDLDSNKVNVIISSADFTGDGFVKNVDKAAAAVGDELTYSFRIKNKGNIPANSVVFSDVIPNGTAFVDGSVIVDGEIEAKANPEAGILLGTITPNTVRTLSFKVIVNTIPSPNPIPDKGTLTFQTNTASGTTTNTADSNTVFTTVTSPNIIITKSVKPEVVTLNGVATYTLDIVNLGNTDADNVVVRDILPSELEFISNTVTINGASTNDNIINGINLGTLEVGEKVKITFNAKAIDIPDSGVIENFATANFEFVFVPGTAPISKTVRSNIARLRVRDLNISLVKTSDSTGKTVNIGDEVTFRVVIANKGNVDVTNFIFKDKLPVELKLVPQSFAYNGNIINVYSLERGVNVGTIKAGETAVITYKVVVSSSNCGCPIENHAYGDYNYKLSAETAIATGTTDVSSVKVNVACPNFRQMSQDGFIELPCDKPCIEEINDVQVTVNILNAHVIKTIAGSSYENQTLTGYKAVITGEIIGSLEYTALTETQSVHSFSFRKSFSTFIILPENYIQGRNIDLSAIVEDVKFDLLDCKKVYTNVTFMITGSIL